jgi:hypothetical protein
VSARCVGAENFLPQGKLNFRPFRGVRFYNLTLYGCITYQIEPSPKGCSDPDRQVEKPDDSSGLKGRGFYFLVFSTNKMAVPEILGQKTNDGEKTTGCSPLRGAGPLQAGLRGTKSAPTPKPKFLFSCHPNRLIMKYFLTLVLLFGSFCKYTEVKCSGAGTESPTWRAEKNYPQRSSIFFLNVFPFIRK